MNTINKNEQWLLDGKCSECRRNKYCNTACTKNKRRTKAIIHNSISSALNSMTNGVYGEIMKNSPYNR